MEADYYLKDNDRFYPAPIFQEVFEFIKKEYEIQGKLFEVTFKVGYINGEVISSRPEYEELKEIAEKTGLPLIKIKELIK